MKYHMRKKEKEITDREEILEVIKGQRFLTLAMSMDDQPYTVPVNYAFDETKDTFYFHCAGVGKKMDVLKANPNVWGQIIEDNGYKMGDCDHAYRCIMFKGKATVIEDKGVLIHALGLLIDQQEDDPAPMKKRNIESGNLKNVHLVKVEVEFFTGKANS